MSGNALAGYLNMSQPVCYYHYCDAHAFLQIIQNKAIWASDLKYMNDPREVGESFRIVAEFLEGMDFDARSPNGNFLSGLRDHFNGLRESTRIFGCSFSKKADDLYSWLNYGSKGVGFSLGLDRDYFMNLWTDVVYDTKDFQDKIEKIWQDGVLKFSGAAEDEERRVAVYTTSYRLQEASAAFKHTSWRAEDEVRLTSLVWGPENSDSPMSILGGGVYEINGTVKYRSSKRGIVPFVNLRLDAEDYGGQKLSQSIAEVIVGPNNKTDIGVLRSLLVENGFTGVRIRKSNCEFED
ncbi:DUF2971 domain-containing protein [Pseudooceanicola sp. C21-150M6]|uniref:DUF2971 domain-containing protein n=1 Tax=Pseudooceanicola sp. C21-150M6 TaxID=3434355 RepID=UPI003D7F610A